MKGVAQRFKVSIKEKEKRLANAGNMPTRLKLLAELSQYYSFTNPEKSEFYLSRLNDLAEAGKHTEFTAEYHYHRAFLENRSYKYHWAESHIEKASELFREEGYSSRWMESEIERAGIRFNLNKTEESEHILDELSGSVMAQDDPGIQARYLARRAMIYARRFTYDKSLDLLIDAAGLLEAYTGENRLSDYYYLSLVYSNIGFAYDKAGKKEEGIIAYREAIKICETFGFGMRLSWYYLHLGNTYSGIGEYKRAQKYFKKAITDTPQDQTLYTSAGASANLGYLFFLEGKYNNALRMYDYAEKLYARRQGLDDDYNFSVLERFRGQLYAELGEAEEALEHYTNALNYAEQIEDFFQMSVVYRDMAMFHEKQENFKEAYHFQVKYGEARESYMDKDKSRSITEIEIKYATEKKEREAEFLRLRATELQLKALRAQMNPHFIFNALNSIQGFLTGDRIKEATVFFSRFSRLMRNSLEFSEFDTIPLEEEIQFLKDYLTLEGERFRNEFTFEVTLDDEIEEDIMGVPPMIFQPFLENSIKHGIRDVENGHISVKFLLEDDDTILCVISDNGIGRDKARVRQQKLEDQGHRSMGAAITEQRLNLINVGADRKISYEIEDLKSKSGKPKGTKVSVRLPVLEVDPRFYE